MMNIQNLSSKVNLALKFKNGICAELCLKVWFESDWHINIYMYIYSNITDSGSFLERLTRNKIPNNHFPMGRPFLLNQKHNVGWFLLRRFVFLNTIPTYFCWLFGWHANKQVVTFIMSSLGIPLCFDLFR